MTARRLRLTIAALAMALGVSGAGAFEAPEGPADHAVPAWYLGMPVMLRAYEILTMEQRLAQAFPADVPRSVSYVTGRITPTSSYSPERTIRLPDGPRVLPDHQATIAEMASPDRPVMSIGYFVIPGPDATPETVRTQAQPADSWASAALATHIRVAGEWLGLNNHIVIEHGLRTGLLALEYFDGGGVMWATLDWEAYRYEPGNEVACSVPPANPAQFLAGPRR